MRGKTDKLDFIKFRNLFYANTHSDSVGLWWSEILHSLKALR